MMTASGLRRPQHLGVVGEGGQPGVLAEHVEHVAGGVAHPDHLDARQRAQQRQVREPHLAQPHEGDPCHRGVLASRRRSSPGHRPEQCLLVLGADPLPGELALEPFASQLPQASRLVGVERRGQLRVELVLVGEVERALAGHPRVVDVAPGDDGVAGRHRLDERGVGAADGVAVEVDPGVPSQRAHDDRVVHGPEEAHLVAGRGPHRTVVRRRRAGSRRARPGACRGGAATRPATISRHGVLGDGAADHRGELARREAELVDRAGGCVVDRCGRRR